MKHSCPPQNTSTDAQDNTQQSPYKIKRKPSKHADFMHAYKIKTPKYKFYVERGGNRGDPIILLIMGLGAQSLVWSNVFCKSLIDAGFQVIRFDNRDIGKSSKIKHKNKLTHANLTRKRQLQLLLKFKLGIDMQRGDLQVPYDLFDMAEDVNQLMQAFEIEACHVIGMSMGGMIAQILATQQPDKIQTLGLLATSNNRPWLPPPSLKALSILLRPSPDKSNMATVIESNMHLMKAIGSPDYYDKHRTYARSKRLTKRRFYPKGTARQLMAILATGSLHTIDTKITQPTLILHGTHDRLLPPAHAKSLAKSIPNATLDLVAGLGHDIPYPLARLLAQKFAKHIHHHLTEHHLTEAI